jgi:acetyl-CoA acetyltransferase
VCGSGLRAVALASQAILTGDARIVIAGGQESMSLSAHAQNLRPGTKMGDLQMIDTMIKDGLTDAFAGYHMGHHAENLADATRSPAPSRRLRRRLAEQGIRSPRRRAGLPTRSRL